MGEPVIDRTDRIARQEAPLNAEPALEKRIVVSKGYNWPLADFCL
jgi:hypothetical protein